MERKRAEDNQGSHRETSTGPQNTKTYNNKTVVEMKLSELHSTHRKIVKFYSTRSFGLEVNSIIYIQSYIFIHNYYYILTYTHTHIYMRDSWTVRSSVYCDYNWELNHTNHPVIHNQAQKKTLKHRFLGVENEKT